MRMKLELDLSNRTMLLRKRNELQRALELVELALKGSFPEDRSSTNGLNWTEEDFDRLPDKFVITDVMGDDRSKSARDKARYEIMKWIRQGKVRIAEVNRGRVGNTYEKIPV